MVEAAVVVVVVVVMYKVTVQWLFKH